MSIRQFQPGETIKNRFSIQSRFCHGRNGLTYLAYDQELRRQVVLKGFIIDNGQVVNHALREARLICELNSPHIIEVYDHFTNDGVAFHVTPYYKNGTLQDKLDNLNGSPMAEEEVMRILRQICIAIGFIYQRNKVHADIKPSNIVLSAGGEAVLIDFESMVRIGQPPVSETPGYASLEQQKRLGLDQRADIYSLAAVAYVCLTGNLIPMASERLQQPDPIQKLSANENASEFLKSIDKALHLDKYKRPTSVIAWQYKWPGTSEAGQIRTPPEGKGAGLNKTTTVVAVAAVATALGASGGYLAAELNTELPTSPSTVDVISKKTAENTAQTSESAQQTRHQKARNETLAGLEKKLGDAVGEIGKNNQSQN